jgi:hypothetical protein
VQLKVLVLDSQCTSAKLEGLDTCTSLEELSLNKCGIKSLEGFPTLPFLKVRAAAVLCGALWAARKMRSTQHPRCALSPQEQERG